MRWRNADDSDLIAQAQLWGIVGMVLSRSGRAPDNLAQPRLTGRLGPVPWPLSGPGMTNNP
jgi:hypothetical protein